jgi:hypothetical protein
LKTENEEDLEKFNLLEKEIEEEKLIPQDTRKNKNSLVLEEIREREEKDQINLNNLILPRQN